MHNIHTNVHTHTRRGGCLYELCFLMMRIVHVHYRKKKKADRGEMDSFEPGAGGELCGYPGPPERQASGPSSR